MTLQFDAFGIELAGAARPLLDRVSLTVAPGEIVGLVGESGSGKSTTVRAALGLVPEATTISGVVRVDGASVFDLDPHGLRELRSRRVALVYQNPRDALNPVRSVGAFATEQLQTTLGVGRAAARSRVVELFDAVGLRDPERLLAAYPHQLSGGMLQRVAIATALAGEPGYLLADEATSALDVSTQAAIVALLAQLRRERGLGMLFVTHDLALASSICDRLCVMYAGRIVESRPGARLLRDARHPYSAGLRDSAPELLSGRRIRAIEGVPPSLDDALTGCAFAPRCRYAEPRCRADAPAISELDDGSVRCLRHAELRLAVTP